MPASEKIKKCLKEGERGKRHQGLRKTRPSSGVAQEHVAKAIHNLEAMTAFHDLKYSDWSASAAFYSLYHCILALLAQRGYESRNQSCTFAMIEGLISNGSIKEFTLADLKEIFDRDVTEDLEHS